MLKMKNVYDLFVFSVSEDVDEIIFHCYKSDDGIEWSRVNAMYTIDMEERDQWTIVRLSYEVREFTVAIDYDHMDRFFKHKIDAVPENRMINDVRL